MCPLIFVFTLTFEKLLCKLVLRVLGHIIEIYSSIRNCLKVILGLLLHSRLQHDWEFLWNPGEAQAQNNSFWDRTVAATMEYHESNQYHHKYLVLKDTFILVQYTSAITDIKKMYSINHFCLSEVLKIINL